MLNDFSLILQNERGKETVAPAFCEANVRVALLVWLGWRWRLSLAPFIAGNSFHSLFESKHVARLILFKMERIQWDDQGLSFAFCCGSVGSELQSFTLLVQCHILKGTLELKVLSIYSQMLFTHQTEELWWGLPTVQRTRTTCRSESFFLFFFLARAFTFSMVCRFIKTWTEDPDMLQVTWLASRYGNIWGALLFVPFKQQKKKWEHVGDEQIV